MGSVAQQSVHQALLNLERSTAPADELIDELARLLDIKFDELRTELLHPSTSSAIPDPFPVFAPEKEWALRWLLKRTRHASTASGLKGHSNEPNMNTDPRKWLLFSYLVPRTPAKRLAKILRDHDGVRQMTNALAQLSPNQCVQRSPTPSSWHSPSPSTNSIVCDADNGRSGSRKRKRSLGSELSPSLDAFVVVFSILKTLNSCIDYMSPERPKETSALNHIRVALMLEPETVASLLSELFKATLAVLDCEMGNNFAVQILDLLQRCMQLWNNRRGPEMGHSYAESSQFFTRYLFHPCLAVIKYIRDNTFSTRFSNFETVLIDLVSCHTVQSVRRTFFEDLVSTWELHSDPISQQQIQPVIQRLQRLICGVTTEDNESQAAEFKVSSTAPFVSILLEITIMSLPRKTLAKTQHEQPWIDGLVMSFSQINPSPPVSSQEKLADHARGAPATPISPCNKRTTGTVEAVITCLIGHHISLSLPVLVAIAQDHAGLASNQFPAWTLIEKLMRLDINLFLPNGIPAAEGLLPCLIERLNDWSTTAHFDRRLGVSICSLLVRGFASSRDLAGFVDIWSAQLSNVNYPSYKPELQSTNFWDDEDIISAFSGTARLAATPDFIESHLMSTAEAFSEEELTGKHYGLIIVADVLIVTNKEEVTRTENLVQLISSRTQQTLQSAENAGKLEAWLWRLQRHIFPHIKAVSPPLLFSRVTDNATSSMVKAVLQCRTSAAAFAKLERFRCFCSMSVVDPAIVQNRFPAEARTISHRLDRTFDSARKKTSKLWNGRADNLGGKTEALMACLGCLLEFPQVLCLDIDSTILILKPLARLAIQRGKAERARSSPFASIFQALITHERLINRPGFVKKCIASMEFLTGEASDEKLRILYELPREAMSKEQRKTLTEWQKRNGETQQSSKTGEDGRSQIQSEGVGFDESGSVMRNCDLQGLRQQRPRWYGAHLDEIYEKTVARPSSLDASDYYHLGTAIFQADASSALTRLAGLIINRLPAAQSIDIFCLNADCIRIVLEAKTKSVTQWIVDNVLESVMLTLSHDRGPCIVGSASSIFERLCGLVASLLSRHRVRLGGRHHLLIPVLQRLQRCIFATSPAFSITTKGNAQFRARLPPWVRGTDPGSTDFTGAYKPNKRSVRSLSRLLNSICDPTPSAVKKSGSTQNQLTDATKKSKRISGEFMQYFIAEYTYCQLNGNIEPEAKQALMPGLYAAVDAMDRKLMRAMNAAMDADQRAIWKRLYDDWMQFGKWNGM